LVYTPPVLETIFGSRAAARVLLYLENYGEGYAGGIARTFAMPLFAVQRQLRKFEDGGVLTSRLVGRARVYTWNARNPTTAPLRRLLAESLKYVPEEEIRRYYRERRRPRRAGKPL
jgi:hypothetical protein